MNRILIIASVLVVGMASTLLAVGGTGESSVATTGGQGMAVDTALSGQENDLPTSELLALTGMGHGLMGGPLSRPASVSDEQWEKLQKAQTEAVIALRPKVLEMRKQMEAMTKIMHTYPVDQQAAAAQWKTVAQLRDELFQAHLAMVSQAQQILGQEAWLSAQIVRPLGPQGGQGMMHAR